MSLGSVAVQVNNHDVEGVSLIVHAPYPLKGVIRTTGDNTTLPAGIALWLESLDAPGWEETTRPLKDGSFDFENVPAGRYRVHVQEEPSGQYYLKALRYGGIESSGPAFFFSGTAGVIELTLSAHGALVSGVVTRKAAGSTTPQVVLLPGTLDAELRLYESHLGVLDQSGGFTVKKAVRPGDYILYAFEGVPDGAWNDMEFMKEIEGKGVRIKVGEGDVKTFEVPLISESDTAALLTRLGMN